MVSVRCQGNKFAALAQEMLTLDHRERALVKLLPEATVDTLAVGDVVCHSAENDILFICERKTVEDLARSLIDGRLNEQKSRLLDSGAKVLIIVEGDFRSARFPYDRLIAACAAATVRDQCPVVRTLSIAETAVTIKHMAKHACSLIPSPALGVAKRKRDEENVFIRMRMCIPSFSESVARAVASQFDSVGALREALQDLKSFPRIRISSTATLGKARLKRLATAFA